MLIEAGDLMGGTNRLYYAAFHAARAAVGLKGVYSKTHSGLIGLYAQTFGPAPLLQELFELRQLADYSRQPVKISPQDLDAKILETDVFVRRCSQWVNDALVKGPDEPDPPPDL